MLLLDNKTNFAALILSHPELLPSTIAYINSSLATQYMAFDDDCQFKLTEYLYGLILSLLAQKNKAESETKENLTDRLKYMYDRNQLTKIKTGSSFHPHSYL